MGISSEFYKPFADQLARAGLIACRTDLRGNGSSEVRASKDVNFGYFDLVANDISSAVERVRKHYPSHPIFLMGHSLGGQLAALYLALNSESAHGLITIAAASVHYKQYPFATRLFILASTQLAWAIARLNGSFPGEIVGFGGREAYGVIRDWARQARTGRYELSGCDHEFEGLMAAVEKPVLAISVAGDWIAPEKAVSHLCGKLKRAAVTRWHYRPLSDGQAKIDHFRWVKHAQPIVETISAWILAQGPLKQN